MVVRVMTYKVSVFGLSDIGLVRQNNEDVWAELKDLRFFAIADGMGGQLAGEVAAEEAITALCQIIRDHIGKRKKEIEETQDLIFKSIEEVNQIVFNLGQDDAQLWGMGTTLCCVLFHDDGIVYGHVGDSRIYRLRKNRLEQLTKDHSLVMELVDLGELTEDQAENFLYKNIITKAIGTDPYVVPTVEATEVMDGDIYMMCTDGLSDLLDRGEIEDVMNQSSDIEEIGKSLVQTAISTGGTDNVTVVLMKIEQ